MGRALLTVCLAALIAGCAADETPDGAPQRTALAGAAHDPHGDLPCAACHTGALVGTRIAAAPREGCTASGCHQEGGPGMVSTGTVTFQHRDHARDGEQTLSCAGCHTHGEGRQPLRVSVDACALCHLPDVGSDDAATCRLCHVTPDHTALTSQGMPIPHSSLPWVETGCNRCHFDVAEAPKRVDTGGCVACHGVDGGLSDRAAGMDLHENHTAVSCTSCHEGDVHRIRAISSAVQLACGDCHVREHNVTLISEWRDDRTCNSCHETVHQSQQRLLLGILPGEFAAPNYKFIAGMTCRSCHIRTPGTVAAGTPIRGQAEACASCHTTEYRQVLEWWVDGTRQKTRSVQAFLNRATADLQGVASDSVEALLASSSSMMALVAEAGGHHNLELSDRIFRETVARVTRAYAMSGRVPPQAPVLGSPAHEGLCSHCHYSPDDPWDFSRMSERFHREVMGGRR
jgi:hypothetical protein